MRHLALALLLTAACASQTATPEQLAQAKQFVNDNLGGFLTRISCQQHEAALRPNGWASLDEQGKRSAVLTLAIHCEGETGLRAITAIDAQSGKTLATYQGSTYTVH